MTAHKVQGKRLGAQFRAPQAHTLLEPDPRYLRAMITR
jgi:hypothetical protein